MLQHKIIEILCTFSKEDIKRFREYLNSPFFNKSEKIIKLYESLIVFHPEFNSKNLTEEKIFKKVNPGLAFNISTFRNLMFDLSNAADDFLTVVNFCQREDVEKKDFLRDEQFKRKLVKQLEAGIKKAELSLNEINEFESQHFRNKINLTTDILNFNTIFKPKSGNEAIVTAKENFTELGRNVTYYFAKEILRVFDNLHSMKKSFDINHENNFVFDVIHTLDFEKFLILLAERSGDKESEKIFKLFLAKYLAFSKFDNDKYYFEYKKLVLRFIKFLGMDEIRSNTINLLRYCMLKSGSDNVALADKFKKERFEVYNFILDNNYYKASVTANIPVELYRAILLLSLDLKKYTWAYNFIKKYRSELPPDRRENLFYFSCAEYYFCRGRYTEAMKSFHKVKLDHFMLKVDMKNLMLRTFYELDLYDSAISHIDSYLHFLAHDKTLSVNEKRINKNFVNIMHKMILYRASGNKAGKFKIEYDLKRDFSHKEWVLEKFAQIDGKFEKSA